MIMGAFARFKKQAAADATHEVTKAAATVVQYLVPEAINVTGMYQDQDVDVSRGIVSKIAQKVGSGVGREVGERLARAALHAMKVDAEESAKEAIERALPISGVAVYVPPEGLYKKYECSTRPTLEVFALSLVEAMQAMGSDLVVDLYAQVVDRSTFERELCSGDGDEATKLTMLLEAIPQVIERSTETAVAIAGLLRDKPSGGPTGKMRDAMYDAAVSAGRPVGGWLYGETTRCAVDLRNLEVVVSRTRPGAKLTPDERALIARVREATWRAILEHRVVDMTRFGSRHGLVPLPVLRDHTVQFLPDPVPHASDEANFGLGEWGLLDSLRRVVSFASKRYKVSDPERAATVASYAERGHSLGQELLGLYVVRQHAGFESAGVGYALAVAAGTMRALPRTSEYAHAIRCMLGYVRALLDTEDEGAKIDDVVAKLRAVVSKPRPTERYELPAVPLACRARPVGHDARTRMLVRDVCAKNGELVEKAKAIAWLDATFGNGKSAAITVDAMFEMHDALGALASHKVGRGVVANVERALAEMQRGRETLTVAQRRRLEVVQTRVVDAGGLVNVDGAGAEVYKHLADRAKEGKPHGLSAHEFGVAHTAFYVGPTVVYRAPLVEDAPAHGAWMGALLALLVPDRVQGVVDAASDAASGRKVQYRGGEPPGVGYALYALLPVIDHASAMGYAAVQRHTLSAVGCLLRAPRGPF